MPRAKRGFKRRHRVKKVRARAEGFVLGRKNKFRRMIEAVDRSFVYAFRDRRAKKRDFRALWVARLSAATSANDISYSRFIGALKKMKIDLNRKVMSEIALHDPSGFKALVNEVRSAAPAH